jgi:hypothetical protein
LQSADVFSPFEVYGIFVSVAPGDHLEIFTGILCGASPQPVESQAEFIIAACIVVVLAAFIQLALLEFPFLTVLFCVPVQSNPSGAIFQFQCPVTETADINPVAKSLTGFVDRVGQDLKKGMLTSIQSV